MSAERELDAAGITEPSLREAYRRCRALNAAHGRTYYLATRMLGPGQRPAVHALYGFARWVDDIVDDLHSGLEEKVAGLAAADAALTSALTDAAGRRGPRRRARPDLAVRTDRQPVTPASDRGTAADRVTPASDRAAAADRVVPASDRGTAADPVVAAGDRAVEPVVVALADTVRRYDIPAEHFRDFLASMRMDLTVTDYATRAELSRYVHGSAAVIGLQVLPVLGTVGPREEAEPAAAALGIAFQLTNFLRDVGEDLDRGRVYLPADELAAFGVDRDRLAHARATGRADDRVAAALRDQVARAREVYARAVPGIALLAPRSRTCVSTAYRLYGRILDLVEEAGADVLSRRVVVSHGRRLAVALPAFAKAVLARAA
ncbi:phytoene/squalene synthase family protein [Actinosynnema sp. NPDC004786]